MFLRRAQIIADQIDRDFGISIDAYDNRDLERLCNKLEEFLELDISTDDLDAINEDDAPQDEEE
jgi:hypothetical protein